MKLTRRQIERINDELDSVYHNALLEEESSFNEIDPEDFEIDLRHIISLCEQTIEFIKEKKFLEQTDESA